MKDFLKNHGLWILFAGAVIAVALALLSYFSTNASPLVDLANTITSPFRAVCTDSSAGRNTTPVASLSVSTRSP